MDGALSPSAKAGGKDVQEDDDDDHTFSSTASSVNSAEDEAEIDAEGDEEPKAGRKMLQQVGEKFEKLVTSL